MTEPVTTSSALFGADGTQLPDPLPVLPDPLAGPQRSHWQESPDQVWIDLPPAPDPSELEKAMAALFAAGLAEEEDQLADPGAPAPTGEPAGGPSPAGGAPGAQPPAGPVAQPRSPGAPAGPGAARPAGPVPTRAGSSAPVAASPTRVIPPARPIDLRRGVIQVPATRGDLPPRWTSGLQVGCIIALIIFGVIALNIIAAIIDLVSGLFR